MYRYPIALALCIAAAGCAPITAYVTRDATENEVSMDLSGQGTAKRGGPHRFSAIAFTAGRRGTFITNDSRLTEGKTIFCAEPPPDAISAVLATSAVDLGISNGDKEASAKLREAYQTAAASIAARTQYVEIYRTYVFALCQLQANNANSEMLKQFADITQKTLTEAKGAALASQVKVVITPAPADSDSKPESKPAAEADARCKALGGDRKKACEACKSDSTDDARKQCVDAALKPPSVQQMADCSKYADATEKAKCEKELAEWKKECEPLQGAARASCKLKHPMPKPATQPKP